MDKQATFFRTSVFVGALLVLLSACSNDENDNSAGIDTSPEQHHPSNSTETNTPQVTRTDNSVSSLIANYQLLISNEIDRTIEQSESLQQQVENFLLSPNQNRLRGIRQAWLAAHNQYIVLALPQHFYRNIHQQMQTNGLVAEIDNLKFTIDSWPILPGYLDYVNLYPESGLIYDISVEMTAASVREHHGLYDISEATSGYHPMEFLLWGENKGNERTEGESDLRPFTDFSPEISLSAGQIEDEVLLEQLSNNRRRNLLRLLSQLLSEDLLQLKKVFDDSRANTSAYIPTLDTTRQLALVTQPMATLLTEEILTRSLYPLLNGELEASRQSRFSHSSQNTMVVMTASVEQLLQDVTNSEGTNLQSLLDQSNSDFVQRFYQQLDSSKACLTLLFTSASETAALRTAGAVEATGVQEVEVVECINALTNMADILLYANTLSARDI